jgi:hypothetical protein
MIRDVPEMRPRLPITNRGKSASDHFRVADHLGVIVIAVPVTTTPGTRRRITVSCTQEISCERHRESIGFRPDRMSLPGRKSRGSQ